ncbi:MAG: tetratricopeptide repeat protein [Syntrophobacteraceae bacterium]
MRSLVPFVGAFWVVCCFISATNPLSAQEPEDMTLKLRLAAEMKSRYEDRQALGLYEEILKTLPNHRDALWNAAYLHIRIGWMDKIESSKIRHYRIAYKYAKKVFRLYPDSYDSHYLIGAAKATMADFLSNGEKVRTARELEKHARFLLGQRSDDPEVWYLFAWWHFELSRVSSSDRFFARLFFGGLPTSASTEKAFECMEKAIALRPDYCAYYYDLGLFYERTGDSVKAREFYREAVIIPPKAPEDSIYIAKARNKLKKPDL